MRCGETALKSGGWLLFLEEIVLGQLQRLGVALENSKSRLLPAYFWDVCAPGNPIPVITS